MSSTSNQALSAAYLARRGVSAQWRAFLRALVETLDDHLDEAGRAGLMRAIGGRMADAAPLPHCGTLAEMEGRINDALAAAEWGYAELLVDTGARRLIVRHHAAPTLAAGTHSDGAWISPVLEGLYARWFAAQPGADGGMKPVVASYAPGQATLHYGRG